VTSERKRSETLSEKLRKSENPQFAVCKKNLQRLEVAKAQLVYEEKQPLKQVY
jgi:hypothetical protein